MHLTSLKISLFCCSNHYRSFLLKYHVLVLFFKSSPSKHPSVSLIEAVIKKYYYNNKPNDKVNP